MFLNLITWEFEENFLKDIQIPVLNFYNQETTEFINALKLYNEKKYEDVIRILPIVKEDLDYNLLLASCYFHLNSKGKALEFANTACLICNSYHAFFHYFGFNTSINLYNETKEERFLEKAKFLYKEGMVGNLKEWRSPLIDSLQGSFQKEICIFSTSKVMSLACTKEGLLEAFEESNKHHYNFHLSYSLAHFIRGLCFESLNQKGAAGMEFEKALNMEPKNPFNNNIKSFINLCL